ncbi:MAG: type III pantothenate kinase [Brevinemataceae bacterium]
MIVTIDVGNTTTKAFLFNNNLQIISKKIWSTSDLFDPDRWKIFFEELEELHPGFVVFEKRISCVSWKAFLALRVYFGYIDSKEFDITLPFNSDFLILPPDSPFVFDSMIPLNTQSVSGLVGTDRLLTAFAVYVLCGKSMVIASLGTATTIDLVTKNGTFFSGIITSGVDTSYKGLISRASHLPELSEIPVQEYYKAITSNVTEALASGIYLAHAAMIENIYQKIVNEASLEEDAGLVLTGGRAFSISANVSTNHVKKDNLVSYGLALLPSWQRQKADALDFTKINDYHRSMVFPEYFSMPID